MTVNPTSNNFIQNAKKALADENLQAALNNLKGGLISKRKEAIKRLPEFDAISTRAKNIKDEVLLDLDFYLEKFEKKTIEYGGVVHWAEDANDAKNIILKLLKSINAKIMTKGKTLISEEIGLNEFLEENGIEPVETDLGEYIVQIAGEKPSHIIAPALHKTKENVADLFHEIHSPLGYKERQNSASALVAEARSVLRKRYLEADAGLTGANFLVAETGSTAIVTNEGNGDLTQSLPKMHIVLATIDKVVPTLEDVSTILRVLNPSATGQDMATYVTFSTGPKRRDDNAGPDQFHVVILDNGRSDLIGTDKQDVLRCIRCGACMNHCPVYGIVGGHAYGWVYPGPIGAALNPALIGIEKSHHLPNASTFCGRCEEVCPMQIPLPKIMRHWRNEEWKKKIPKYSVRLMLKLWLFLVLNPVLYRIVSSIFVRILSFFSPQKGYFSNLPFASGWTSVRDFPAPEGKSFLSQWEEEHDDNK